MLRLSDIKGTIANVLNFTSTDARVVDVINRATERLLEGGRGKGTIVRYRVCANNSCITLPRQIETVEAFAVCNVPGTVRGHWWEFVQGGPGMQDDDTCFHNELIHGPEASGFDNVSGTNKKLSIYSDVDEASDGFVILQFYNDSAQWVRTKYPAASTTYIDGERLALPAGGAYMVTTNLCMANGFVTAIKSRTRGTIRLYEHNVGTGALKPLAYWEPDEEVPRYRTVLIPGLTGLAETEGGECAKQTVVIQGKARFVPVYNDNDLLQIHSREAIRLGCQAVAKEEKDLMADAANYWAMAFRVLDTQLRHFLGSGATQPIQIINAGITGPNVPNMI